MMLYSGPMVKAEILPDDLYQGWVYIEWLYPGEKKFQAVKDVKRIEKLIRDQKFKGWLASSEKDHTTMHKILAKMGAFLYQQNDHALYFMKEVI